MLTTRVVHFPRGVVVRTLLVLSSILSVLALGVIVPSPTPPLSPLQPAVA
ncbi:MAG TPA: hypothetical protein VFF70_09360 [Anaerolineae bacterium]|nr:hypothetical protein [Anaerolineae bacterium]